MTHDASHSYTYDAENRITKVDGGSTATYGYDVDGRRVSRVVAGVETDYIYDLSGRVVADYGGGCGATCWRVGYVYLNGEVVAEYFGGTYFAHGDHLGSTRLLSGYPTATVAECDDYYPFGEQISCGGTSTTTHKFTGYERDAETGLDNAQARYNSSSLGRFMSPDPLGNFVADATNPQTWNRYAYVNNNPLAFVDPTGLCGGADYGWWPSDTEAVVVGDDSCFDPSMFGWAFTGLPFPILHGGPSGGGGGGGSPTVSQTPQTPQAPTLTCTVSSGRTTAPAPGQAPGKGAFGFVPPVGSVAIDPMALGLFPGAPTNGLLGPSASQISFDFSPAPALPAGFSATHTLGSIVGPKNARAGGSYFHGLYDFDIFGLPSLAAARAATSSPGVPVVVTVTFPSSLPINCGGPIADPVLPPSGQAAAFSRARKRLR